MNRLSNLLPIKSPDEVQSKENENALYSQSYYPMCTSAGRECTYLFDHPEKSQEPEQLSSKETYYQGEFSSEKHW